MAAVLTPPTAPTTRRPHLHLVEAGPVEPLFTARAVAGTVVIALVLLVGMVAVGRGALADLAPQVAEAPAEGSAAEAAGRTVIAGPGDTMWSIAREIQPTGDVRPLVDALVAAHGSSIINVGDRIVVPE